jgi:uncharacterized protein (DUF1330 family)
MGASMTLVAILTVRKDAEEKFRAFERQAAAAMGAYGGRIERTVIIAPEGRTGVFKEVHVVTFPSMQAYADYRNDPRLGQLARLRDESVVDTEVLFGEEGPDYHVG